MPTLGSRLRKGQVVAVALTTATLLIVTACSSSSKSGGTSSSAAAGSSAADKTTLPASIPVALVADLTGTLSFYGTQLQAGVKAGIDAVNSTDMLHGAKFVLATTKDTTFDVGRREHWCCGRDSDQPGGHPRAIDQQRSACLCTARPSSGHPVLRADLASRNP